jgi:hemolysin activation/secretion protein
MTYQYYSLNIAGYRATSNLLGERIFVRQQIPMLSQLLGQGYLTAQLENFNDMSAGTTGAGYSNPFLVGIGIGSRMGINLSLMYDLNYSATSAKQSPYGSAFVVQVGGFFF